jgi:hypothetical protein
MTTRLRHANRCQLSWGLFLLLLGASAVLQQTGALRVGSLWSLWPLWMVALGLGRWVADGTQGALGWVAGGILLLLHTLRLAPLGLTWPALLVVLGLGIVLDAGRRRAPAREGRHAS